MKHLIILVLAAALSAAEDVKTPVMPEAEKTRLLKAILKAREALTPLIAAEAQLKAAKDAVSKDAEILLEKAKKPGYQLDSELNYIPEPKPAEVKK